MKRFAVFICCLIITVGSQAQNSSASRVLDTGWEFLRSDLGGVWEAVRAAETGRPEGVPAWKPVQLPHCYNGKDAVDPDKNYYQGPAWYRTKLDIDNPYKNGRILLHFGGAGQKSQVYVYTRKVDEHVGGYDEWTIDITEAVRTFKESPASKKYDGKVPIEVRTDNSRDLQMIPSDMVDFAVYGGLYRPVMLVYVPGFSLQTLHITPTVDAKGRLGKVTVSASLRNTTTLEHAQLSLSFRNPSGQVVKTYSKEIEPWDGMKEVFNFSVDEPDLWSPDHPSLYSVTAELSTNSGKQTIHDQFGFRHFRFAEHGPFYLNGKRLLLRGTHRHADWAGVGAGETAGMIRREFKMIKDMGANFIRLAHYQQRDLVVNLCDSLGLLVWEEIPWNRGGLGGVRYQQQGRRMLNHMITQHYNHPSIIIWSLGNENDWPGDFPEFNEKKIRAYMSQLNALSHELDPTRKTAIRRCDFCKDIVDVYSPSIWAGWYGGLYTEYREATHKAVESVDHFFHAEWGADSHARRHAEDPYKNLGGIPAGAGVAEHEGDAARTGGTPRASRDGDWSETYQCDVIDWHLKEQRHMPWLTGSAQWIFKDFVTPLRPNNPIPYINEKGVVTRDLKPKEGYYVFQSYWTNEPMAHIYGHTWPVRWGDEGEKKQIKVYSNCPKAELFVNGKSYGTKKRNPDDFPAAGLRWEVPLHKGDYHVRVVARKGSQQVTDSVSFRYQTAKWGKPAQMRLEKVAEQGDTTTVRATLLDEKGVLCLDSKKVIRFGLTGDGQLLDNLGTSNGSRKLEAYNGRALIKIDTGGGENVASVRSQGLPTAFLKLGKIQLASP